MNYVDPDGREYNPIYDIETGMLLGTDDEAMKYKDTHSSLSSRPDRDVMKKGNQKNDLN